MADNSPPVSPAARPPDARRDDDAAQEASRQGRAVRAQVPRSSLRELVPSPRTATEILLEQNSGRLPALAGLRMARMLVDPFTFFRGSAAVMAADLAEGPSPGLEVVANGDAHLANFGFYAAPHRALVFDLNDFDETAFAPAEWDLKRLAASVVVGGRHAQYPDRVVRAAVRDSLTAYRDTLTGLLRLDPVERYYRSAEPGTAAVPRDLRAVVDRTVRRARKRTSADAYAKIVVEDADGLLRLRESPPVLQHLPPVTQDALGALLARYASSVPVDVAVLLSHYRLVDLVQRVVGVGSVGTRCYLAVLLDPAGRPLVLQVKQASDSVLAHYGNRPQPANLDAAIARQGQGGRVISGQRVMQAASDVFLGSVQHNGIDYYVRQFRDMKGSIDLPALTPAEFTGYAVVCGRLLARAHVQSPGAAAFAGYLGGSNAALHALDQFAHAYADKSLDDFHQLTAAAQAGDVEVAADPLR